METSAPRYVYRVIDLDGCHPIFVQSLSRIALVMASRSYSVPRGDRTLAAICKNIQVYMETRFGSAANKVETFMKLPAKFFRMFQPDGPLTTILDLALQYQQTKNWDHFDLSRGSESENLEFFRSMERSLIESGFLRVPRIYFNFSEQNSELNARLKSTNAVIVDEMEQATHIVHANDSENATETDSVSADEFIRVVDMRPDSSNFALVHWCNFPESYDAWIHTDDIETDGNLKVVKDTRTLHRDEAYQVSVKYLVDSVFFNEWCKESDYEVSNDSKTMKATSQQPAKYKLKRRYFQKEKLPPSLNPNNSDIKVSISAKRKGMDESSNVGESKRPRRAAAIAAAAATSGSATASSASSSTATSTNNASNSVATSQDVKYPKWFNIDNISVEEMRFLPDLLSSESKITREEYIKTRNSICAAYKQNPNVYLSATESRKKFNGDVCFIIRIHEFLDSFGLINQQLKADCRPPMLSNVLGRLEHSQELRESSRSHADSNIPWTQEMDAILLQMASRHHGNWEHTCQALRAYQVSPHDCFARYMVLTYGDCDVNCMSKPISSMIKQVMKDSQLTTEKLLKDVNHAVEMQNDLEEPAETVATAFKTAAITKYVINTLKEEKKRLLEMLDDYLSARVELFDEKIRSMEQMESILDIERDHLDAERRNVLIQRAQITILTSASASAPSTSTASMPSTIPSVTGL